MRKNKIVSLFIILFIYLLSFVIGFISSIWITNPLLQLFFADVIATIVVWIFSLILKNTSVYDPYWSLVPWVIATYFIFVYFPSDVWTYVLYGAFSLWSWRLTINWIITFENLYWEDWRYRHYRSTCSKPIFHIINFAGLQMMPTLLVYAGTLPLLLLIQYGCSLLSIIGSVIVLIGVMFEFLADHQMHEHLRITKNDEVKTVCKRGLWKLSRHPNYLGENLIWIGIAVAFLTSMIDSWYFGLGFVLMLLLFEFISIPLMENRQKKRRSDYLEYIKTTSRMFIYPKPKKK